ncbi:MAG TPA: hypothetical protein VD837_07250 [Terriglobales bacterium]|nr:hypothetical protein [Terriglobales bacterium]
MILRAFVCLIAAGMTITASPAAAPQSTSSAQAFDRAAADSAHRKFQKIQANAQKSAPDQRPTTFTEREINAYIASPHVRLPRGVQRVRFTGNSGVITTDATVNFDQVTEGARSNNPLLALFSGTHQVQVVSHASASGGQAQIQIDKVLINGVQVPRMALEFFINKYIKPKYPELGLDSRINLPERIDTATVGNHVLAVTQK